MNAKRIGLFLSMPQGELSTREAVLSAFKQGKHIFVPYIYKSYSQSLSKMRSVMDMVSLHSIEDYENLQPDGWGIPSISDSSLDERNRILGKFSMNAGDGDQEKLVNNESSPEHELLSFESLDTIVMPGVAFDRGLGRLGHGKGFYDYFLERYQASKAGPMPFLGTLQ